MSTSEHPEPPDGTRIEFQEYGSPGGDLIAICRDDASSAEAGYKVGDGGEVWCEYGRSVPISWAEVLADPRLAACVNGTRLVPAREGWAQAIEALRAQGPGMTGWWAAADYLTDRAAALTEEGGQ